MHMSPNCHCFALSSFLELLVDIFLFKLDMVPVSRASNLKSKLVYSRCTCQSCVHVLHVLYVSHGHKTDIDPLNLLLEK